MDNREQFEEQMKLSPCYSDGKKEYFATSPNGDYVFEIIESAYQGYSICAEQKDKEIAGLERSLKVAMKNWDGWKMYAIELNERLQKYEKGSPMILNKLENKFSIESEVK